jgi:hypothetical protein
VDSNSFVLDLYAASTAVHLPWAKYVSCAFDISARKQAMPFN